jgi:hypothetical protein
LGEVLDRTIAQAFAPAAGRTAEIARRVQTRTTLDLAAVARDPKTSPAVAAEIDARLAALVAKLKTPVADPADRAHRAHLAALLADKEDLARVLGDPKLKPEIPPGMPIGDEGEF